MPKQPIKMGRYGGQRGLRTLKFIKGPKKGFQRKKKENRGGDFGKRRGTRLELIKKGEKERGRTSRGPSSTRSGRRHGPKQFLG